MYYLEECINFEMLFGGKYAILFLYNVRLVESHDVFKNLHVTLNLTWILSQTKTHIY